MKKIFQIGFNKCGSTSLHNFFIKNNIKSIHWDSGKLSRKIFDNFECKKGLITGYEKYQAFTDMVDVDEFFEKEVHVDLFTNLYDEFPDSIYIFNDRNLEQWIESRMAHGGGQYALYAQKRLGVKSLDDVKSYWLRRYDEHKKRVISFFKGKENFVHLYIDDELSVNKLIQFLRRSGFKISDHSFPHRNKTLTMPNIGKFPNSYADVFRDAALFFEETDPQKAYHLMEVACLIRPTGRFIRKKLNEYKANKSFKRDRKGSSLFTKLKNALNL